MDRAVEAKPFTDKIAELAADLSASATNVTHPLLEKHQSEARTTILVLTSNRGLCGGYNANILREANAIIRSEQAAGRTVTVDVSGKRGINYFRFSGQPFRNTYLQFEDKPRFDEVEGHRGKPGSVRRVDHGVPRQLGRERALVPGVVEAQRSRTGS